MSLKTPLAKPATAGPPKQSNGPPLLLWLVLLVAGAAHSVLRFYVDLALADGIEIPAARTWIGRDFTNLWVGSRLALARA